MLNSIEKILSSSDLICGIMSVFMPLVYCRMSCEGWIVVKL